MKRETLGLILMAPFILAVMAVAVSALTIMPLQVIVMLSLILAFGAGVILLFSNPS